MSILYKLGEVGCNRRYISPFYFNMMTFNELVVHLLFSLLVFL